MVVVVGGWWWVFGQRPEQLLLRIWSDQRSLSKNAPWKYRKYRWCGNVSCKFIYNSCIDCYVQYWYLSWKPEVQGTRLAWVERVEDNINSTAMHSCLSVCLYVNRLLHCTRWGLTAEMSLFIFWFGLVPTQLSSVQHLVAEMMTPGSWVEGGTEGDNMLAQYGDIIRSRTGNLPLLFIAIIHIFRHFRL